MHIGRFSSPAAMNLILLHPVEVDAAQRGERLVWSATDERAKHVREVLRKAPGDTVLVGVPNGPRLWARLCASPPHDERELALELALDDRQVDAGPSPAPWPVTLLVGLSRPQTMRKVLFEGSALGVREFHLARTDLGERSYATAKLWTDPQEPWRRYIAQGAEQARSTYLPTVTHHPYWGAALEALAERVQPPQTSTLALELPEVAEAGPLSAYTPSPEARDAVLALGSERGFTERERQRLRAAGYKLVSLGPRPLRTETACVAGLTLLAARHGWI